LKIKFEFGKEFNYIVKEKKAAKILKEVHEALKQPYYETKRRRKNPYPDW
jgi:hypothetical protein